MPDQPPKIEIKELPLPKQCTLWRQPELVMSPSGRFEVVEAYADESHLYRALLKCHECGQLYFHESYERVDWEGGDDSQYWTYIPLPDPSEAQRMKGLDIYNLLTYTPRLQWDRPTGKPQTVRWIGGD